MCSALFVARLKHYLNPYLPLYELIGFHSIGNVILEEETSFFVLSVASFSYTVNSDRP